MNKESLHGAAPRCRIERGTIYKTGGDAPSTVKTSGFFNTTPDRATRSTGLCVLSEADMKILLVSEIMLTPIFCTPVEKIWYKLVCKNEDLENYSRYKVS